MSEDDTGCSLHLKLDYDNTKGDTIRYNLLQVKYCDSK